MPRKKPPNPVPEQLQHEIELRRAADWDGRVKKIALETGLDEQELKQIMDQLWLDYLSSKTVEELRAKGYVFDETAEGREDFKALFPHRRGRPVTTDALLEMYDTLGWWCNSLHDSNFHWSPDQNEADDDPRWKLFRLIAKAIDVDITQKNLRTAHSNALKRRTALNKG